MNDARAPKAAAALLVLACACHPPSRDEWPRQRPEDYADGNLWLCRPDLPTDVCRGDLTTTEIHADGTRTVVKRAAAVDPGIDCFYVYPTVDLGLGAGNHVDFTDRTGMETAARGQVAQFATACAVYAPFYRQVTLGTYMASRNAKDRFLAVAYSDVLAAFRYYLAHDNQGHKLVLIGHSQGAQMIAQLLADTVDQDAALRKLLVVAMPIGQTITTPVGQPVGGSFQHLAACTSDEQAGCVVAYRSLAVGDRPSASLWGPIAPGVTTMCVSPGRVLHTFAPSAVSGLSGLTTPYVSYDGFYEARCVADPAGRDFLEISEVNAPGDVRVHPIDLTKHHGGPGLHIYDLSLPQGNLIDLVTKKAAAMKAP